MRVIYILGLSHSGTTIVERILSCYPGTIGLGEAEHVHKELHRGTIVDADCPCGRRAVDCEFWKPVMAEDHETPAAFFDGLIRTAHRQGYTTVIDSSKSVGTSTQYQRMVASGGPVDDLVLLRIVRDPRGWVHSMMRRERIAEADVIRITGLFYRWMAAALKMDRRAIADGLHSVYVWYDKLILSRQEDALAEVVGLVPTGEPMQLSKSNQHSIAGNKFAFTEKRDSLSYDSPWLESAVIEQIYAALPTVRAYYHELQKLHLVQAPAMKVDLPRADLARVALAAGMETGDFSVIEAMLSDFSFTAQPATEVEPAASTA